MILHWLIVLVGLPLVLATLFLLVLAVRPDGARDGRG